MLLGRECGIPREWDILIQHQHPWKRMAQSQVMRHPGPGRPQFQVCIWYWTAAELDFNWMPQMNSQGIEFRPSWQLMSNGESTQMRYVDFEFAQLHFWASNFWWYWNLPYSHDLEHILKGLPGLDSLLDVEIWNWILSFSHFGSLYQEKYSKYILLHWKMTLDRFPIILKELLNHSRPISI